MKKVSFYIDNSNISSVNLSEILIGNPGIGGTEYMLFLVAYLLSIRNNSICVDLYLRKRQFLPVGMKFKIVDNLTMAIKESECENTDLFVLKHDVENIKMDKLRSNSQMKFIVWCHVFACFWELDYYSKNSSVCKIVFVGREMMDLYRDHRIFDKSVYIYNCLNFEGARKLVELNRYDKRRHIVTYVGSIVPFKGLHLLAEAWPDILRFVPDAELYIIGSGHLYDSSSELGSFGITEASYESKIMKYLSKDGEILPSVHFMGIMGVEKREIFLKTKVGVPNPSGITETFCLSAVEMQAFGARIATIVSPGYIDTVKNGILYKKRKRLVETVVRLLKSKNSDYNQAINYFEKEFAQEVVVEKWEELLHTGKLVNNHKLVNLWFRFKWLKELIRLVSMIIPLNFVIPPVERVLIFFERKILRRITYMDSNLKL